MAPSEWLFGAAAAMNINTEPLGEKIAQHMFSDGRHNRRVPKRLTEPHVGYADRRELQQDEEPYDCRRTAATALDIAGCQVLEWEHRVDDYVCRDTDEDDAPWAKATDDAREEDKLEDAVQAPVSGEPQADRRGTQVEPAPIYRHRPDKWDEGHC